MIFLTNYLTIQSFSYFQLKKRLYNIKYKYGYNYKYSFT